MYKNTIEQLQKMGMGEQSINLMLKGLEKGYILYSEVKNINDFDKYAFMLEADERGIVFK